MPAERYYFNGELKQDESILLQDQEFHHLAHVMRSQPGEQVELVNGRGSLAQGEISSFIKKQGASITIRSVQSYQKGSRRLILAQAMPRMNRLDTILEKGTELGMTDIWLFPGNRSERKDLNRQPLERMQGVMVSAMKQCGRLFLPEMRLMGSLAEWDQFPASSFFGDLDPNAPTLNKAWKGVASEVCFFVGPESGFSPDEIQLLRKRGVVGVKLHDNVLRTDTAALVALTLASSLAS